MMMMMMIYIGLMNSVRQWFGRPGFNSRSSHTENSKMVLDTALLNTQHYKVRIKGKVKQSRQWSSAPLHLGIEKEPSGHHSLGVANFTLKYIYIF